MLCLVHTRRPTTVPLWISENVPRFSPDTAKNNLVGQMDPGAAMYLNDTSAAIVMAVWLVGLLSAALVALNRRDV